MVATDRGGRMALFLVTAVFNSRYVTDAIECVCIVSYVPPSVTRHGPPEAINSVDRGRPNVGSCVLQDCTE